MKVSKRDRRKAKGVVGALYLLGLASLPLIGLAYAANSEKNSREFVLEHGQPGYASVTRSFSVGSRSCDFDYEFVHDGQVFEGGAGGCRLVKDHPVGSTVEVRFLPSDPERSIAVGSDLWPGWTVVPILLVIPILVLFGIVLVSTVAGDGHRARKSRDRA